MKKNTLVVIAMAFLLLPSTLFGNIDTKLKVRGKIGNIDSKTVQVTTKDGTKITVDKTVFPAWTKFYVGDRINITVRTVHIMSIIKAPSRAPASK